jgi:hypothetical protein
MKAGQEVLCIRKNGPWVDPKLGITTHGPAYNEVVYITQVVKRSNGRCFFLRGYETDIIDGRVCNVIFHERHFAEIAQPEAISQLVEATTFHEAYDYE